jgi:hypothetical protein
MRGCGLCWGFGFLGEREMKVAKEGKKNLLPLPLHVREEEDTECHSKQNYFELFFIEQCMKQLENN